MRNERHGNLVIRKAAFERAEAKEQEAQKTKEAQDKAEYGDDTLRIAKTAPASWRRVQSLAVSRC